MTYPRDLRGYGIGSSEINDSRERPGFLFELERRQVIPAVTDGGAFEIEC